MFRTEFSLFLFISYIFIFYVLSRTGAMTAEMEHSKDENDTNSEFTVSLPEPRIPSPISPTLPPSPYFMGALPICFQYPQSFFGFPYSCNGGCPHPVHPDPWHFRYPFYFPPPLKPDFEFQTRHCTPSLNFRPHVPLQRPFCELTKEPVTQIQLSDKSDPRLQIDTCSLGSKTPCENGAMRNVSKVSTKRKIEAEGQHLLRKSETLLCGDKDEVKHQNKRRKEKEEKNDVESESRTGSSRNRVFTCKYCGKVYVSLGALKMHIRTHTLPCKCSICGKAFSRPWLLQGHIRTHTGEKPYKCSLCQRAFADRSNLRAHLQTHSDVKKYNCGKCHKTFSRMSLLVKHEEGGCVVL